MITEAHGIPLVSGHVSEFAKILTGRHGDRFDAWITAVDASGLPDLRSPSHRIKRDYDSVLSGLTLPHSPERSKAT